MDIQMPLVDGFEATSTLRRKGFSKPIVALTASAMAADKKRCIEVGCTGFIAKPVDRDQLLSEIAKYSKQLN